MGGVGAVVKRWARWWARRPFFAALAVIVVVAVPGFVRVEQINTQQDHLVDCLNAWADKVTNRADTLTAAADERATRLDDLIRAVPTQDRAVFGEALTRYIDTSNRYKQLAADNPFPRPPQLHC